MKNKFRRGEEDKRLNPIMTRSIVGRIRMIKFEIDSKEMRIIKGGSKAMDRSNEVWSREDRIGRISQRGLGRFGRCFPAMKSKL